MHEWALAEAVIATVVKVSKEKKLREVKELEIKIGELQQIERGILEFALKQFMREQKGLFKKAKIRFESEKAVLKCNICGTEWDFHNEKLSKEEFEAIHFIPEVAHSYIRCPKCKSLDFQIVKGRGVWVNSIEGI